MRKEPTDHVVARVLGPAATEASCEQCFEQLDRFVDLELRSGGAATRMPELAAHLSGCPACVEDYESLLALARSDQAAG